MKMSNENNNLKREFTEDSLKSRLLNSKIVQSANNILNSNNNNQNTSNSKENKK